MRPFFKITCDLGHVTFATPGSEIEKHRIENGSTDPSVPMHVEGDHCADCLRDVKKHGQIVASRIALYGSIGPS